MKIVFYLEDEGFRWMAEGFVASALRYAPAGTQIVQISPSGRERVTGTHDLCVFDANPGLTFLGRYFSSALFYGVTAPRAPIMFCNVDMLFIRPFQWPTFAGSVALPHIADKRWRWDGAVCLLTDDLLLYRLRAQDACWGAARPITEQLAAIEAAVLPTPIHWLPGHVWSYVPRDPEDSHADTVLVHYRGDRKVWMARAMGVPYTQDWNAERAFTHPGLKQKGRT